MPIRKNVESVINNYGQKGIPMNDFFNIEIPENISAGLGGKYDFEEKIHSPGKTRPEGHEFFV